VQVVHSPVGVVIQMQAGRSEHHIEGGLQQMVEIPGSVNNPVNFDPRGANNVEHDVVLNGEHAIAQRCQIGVTSDASQVRVPAEGPNPLIYRIGEPNCT